MSLALKGAWSAVLHKSIHASAATVVGFHMIVQNAVVSCLMTSNTLKNCSS
jgi:hypothetical protein